MANGEYMKLMNRVHPCVILRSDGLAGIANAVTKIRGAADDNANGNDDSESQQNDNAVDFAGSSSPHHCKIRLLYCMFVYIHCTSLNV